MLSYNFFDDAELEEGVVEEGAPLPIVAVVEVQRDRNVSPDVNEVDGGHGDGYWRCLVEGVGAVCRGACRRHGRRSRTEEQNTAESRKRIVCLD